MSRDNFCDKKKNANLFANKITMDTDSEGNLIMAETIMAAAKSYSACPVCIETLMPPIYQCSNGHIICYNCIERIDKCVECRVPMPQSTRVRNIALEKIIMDLRVDCSNKNEGCNVQLTIEELKNHLQDCRFTPFNFCSNVLGKKDCIVKVNDSTIFSHLEVGHSVTKVHSNSFRLCLNVSKINVCANDFFFEPVVVTSMEVPLLIRSMISADGHFTFTGFLLESNEEYLQSIRLKFRIVSQSNKNQNASFEWSGCAQSYRKFQKTNFTNSFRITVDSLLEFWKTTSQDNTAIVIHVFVWEISSLSQEDDFLEEVHIFEQSHHPRNTGNLQRAASVPLPLASNGSGPLPVVQSRNGNQQFEFDEDSEDLLDYFDSPFENEF